MDLDNMDLANNRQTRDLGQGEDLQLAMDHNEEYQDRQLKTKVLFAVQCLGGVRTIEQNGKYIEAYIKGVHCQDSIKDLVKFIRNDIPDNPKAKLILSEYNIVQTDLSQLLLLQVEDKKLSFWLIALLASMTSKPSDENLLQEDKEKLYNALREYKRVFVKHECLTILTLHIADYFKTEPSNRQKAHYQMLEFIILLIRNLLQIPDSKEDNDSLHNHFLATFIRQEMFNPLLYLIQNEKGDILDKIDIPLLEIFYYTFSCFEPDMIYQPKQKIDYLKLASESKSARGNVPLRHSRFQPLFSGVSDVGVKRINHSLHNRTEPINNQRKVPRRTADLKKVQKIELDTFAENFMEIEFEVIDNESKKSISRKIGELVAELSEEFVEVEFPQLSEMVFNQIYKETAKVTPQNVIQYLLLCNWAIKMTRAKFLKQKSEATSHVQAEQVEFDLGQIGNIMQTAHFQLIYKTLFRQATREKKRDFKVNTFNAAMKLFENYLCVISDISVSFLPNDRKNANVLMANIFRHDIARIFKIGFLQISHQGILATLIRVCHKFYKLLSKYSNGKVLTIQTNKLLKRKNKKNRRVEEEENMENFISDDGDDSDGSKSYHEGDQLKQHAKPHKKQTEREVMETQGDDNQGQMFQERKFNEISEFAIIAEYDIISKYLIFLKNERILRNSDDFNDAIFFYFEQICKLLKGEWLFFQAESLVTFQSILAVGSELTKKNRKNVDKIKLIRNICRQFIKLTKRNNLALVQSFFQYPNLTMKENIMRNYQNGHEVDVDKEDFHEKSDDEA